MRKRSRYKPRLVLVNPLNYVMESLTPVSQHDSFLIDLKIKNHGAMSALTRGVATRKDMDLLINMVNVTEALYMLGFGEDYKDVVQKGLDALHEVAKRGAQSNHFIVKAQEMNDLNTVMDLHDAQMELATVKDMDRAAKLIEQQYRQRKMRPIK